MKMEQRRWWALIAVSLSVLAVGIDGTVLSIALPTLAGVLHASEAQLEWFSAGYLLMLAAAVLPAGLLGDRFGRKKVLLASLLVFGAGSVLCAYSTSPEEFLVARLVMGVAGAGIAVMALSAVTVFFDEATRPKAVGVFAAANFLSLPLGPIVGGWMLANLWWGWVFLLNVPVVVIGLLAVLLLIPESRAESSAESPAGHRSSLDVVGILSSVAGLVVFTFGIVEAGQHGWTDAAALASLAIGFAVLTGFVFWEIALTRRGRSPLVDTRLFRSRAFAGGAILAGVAGMGMVGLLFVMPQFFQAVQGVDVFVSGLRLLPFVGGMLIGALPASRISARIGYKATVALAFVVIGIGSVLGSFTVRSTGEGYIAIWMAVVCAGAGLGLTASMAAAVSQLTAERSGIGSGLVQALQKTSAPLGTAILGSVVAAVYSAQLAKSLSSIPALAADSAAASAAQSSVYAGAAVAARLHSPQLADAVRTAFTHGMSVSLLVSAGIAVIGAIMAVVILPRTAQAGAVTSPEEPPSRRTAHAEPNG
ncbi:DHA2 family efflux MFS transporter permease subunit [Humibacter antri]